MYKIVLTGGPSSGKSSSLARIEENLTARGWKVFIVEESATNIVQSGIRVSEQINKTEFQRFVLENQLHNEELISRASNLFNKDKVIILCDRGIMDGLAFLEKEKFWGLLKEYNLTKRKVFSRYDGVIHMVTAAKEYPESYSLENKARTENIEEAIVSDDKTMDCWVGHPRLKIVNGKPNFEDKIEEVLKEIYNIVGEPVSKEIEKKFLIKRPSDEQLSSIDVINKAIIVQTYLKPTASTIERRLRQRGSDGDYSYYYAEKVKTKNPEEKIETEKKITVKEYVSLMEDVDFTKHQIIKTRYCFIYKNQYFELDIFPFDKTKAILEIECKDKESIVFPDFIEIISDVTNDNKYKNISISETLNL